MIIDREKKIIYEVVTFVATFFVSKKMIVCVAEYLKQDLLLSPTAHQTCVLQIG